jgi:hypothetical protein
MFLILERDIILLHMIKSKLNNVRGKPAARTVQTNMKSTDGGEFGNSQGVRKSKSFPPNTYYPITCL